MLRWIATALASDLVKLALLPFTLAFVILLSPVVLVLAICRAKH